ncbi:MAG: lipid-A-disaccharide synthase [Planctomycetes bacterium]|nr:lipid-A-disaccharide synthase [Planctomycetota bacterium]
MPMPVGPLAKTPSGRPMRVVLSCGDASGEAHAVRLLHQLRKHHVEIEPRGFGGIELKTEGMQVWEPLADLNVMGFKDVLARLPLFFRCVRRFAEELRDDPPDLVILVDYPGLNRHLLRVAGRAGIPVVNYIAPQLWAWAPWRVRDFRHADRLLTILPFESDWYAQHGASAQYVGHPLGDGLEQAAASEATLPDSWQSNQKGLYWVGILPGSRRREILENLPVLLEAAAELQKRRPDVRFVLPHLRSKVDTLLREILATAPIEVLYAPGCFHRVLPHLRSAWVASGTALLEVAAHRVPPVLVYQVSSRLGAWLSRHWLAVPYVGNLNLIANRELAPEHLGRKLNPQALADDLEARLDGTVREQALTDIEALRPGFAEPGSAARTAAILAQIVE